jgi:hypothetical protein
LTNGVVTGAPCIRSCDPCSVVLVCKDRLCVCVADPLALRLGAAAGVVINIKGNDAPQLKNPVPEPARWLSFLLGSARLVLGRPNATFARKNCLNNKLHERGLTKRGTTHKKHEYNHLTVRVVCECLGVTLVWMGRELACVSPRETVQKHGTCVPSVLVQTACSPKRPGRPIAKPVRSELYSAYSNRLV